MLRVMIVGNLGADPEVRFTAKGDEMVSVRVAVNSRRRDQENNWTDHTDWFRVRAMGNLGNQLKRMRQGDRLTAIGELQIDMYKGNDGTMRTSLDLWADDVEPGVIRPREDADGKSTRSEADRYAARAGADLP